MNFEWFFSKVTSKYKNTKNQFSSIILISRISIFLGIIIIYLTFSIGLGTRYSIKEKFLSFFGHVIITTFNSNNFYNSSPISIHQSFYPTPLWKISISNLNEFAMKTGIIRTEKDIEHIIFKGVSHNYNWIRFKNFLFKGRKPSFNKNSLSYEVLVSKKIASLLKLNIGDSFIIYFFNKIFQTPIFKRFFISGLYDTGIKNFDYIIIGDIRQIVQINHWKKYQIGGFEVFSKNINDINFLEKEINKNINIYGLNAKGILNYFDNIKNWIKIFDINIFIITLIVSIVVIINIIVFLIIIIINRSYTIGVLKTLGISNISIRKIFIYYAFRILFSSILWGNLISLSLLLLQKYFNIIHLNSEEYYISFIPIYFSTILIISINITILLIFLLTLWISSIFINKISPINSIKFC